jgi:hypothetical protein
MDEIVIAYGAYQMYFDEFRKYYSRAQPWSTDGARVFVSVRVKSSESFIHLPHYYLFSAYS